MTIEDTTLQERLRELATDPLGPSTVELERAVRDARRRIRIRTALAGAAAVVAVLAIVATAGVLVSPGHRQHAAQPIAVSPSRTPAADAAPQPPGDCTAQVLPVPDRYVGIVVMGIDPTGRYLVGRGFGPDNRYHPLLWTDGRLSNLDPKGTAAEVDGIAVNSAGVVAWSSSDAARGGDPRASWRYQAGQRTRLSVPPDFMVSAVDAAGDVLGVSVPASVFGKSWMRLPAAGGDPVSHDIAPADPQDRVSLRKVDTDGTVVGNPDPKAALQDDASPLPAFAWSPDGTVHPLTAPNGYGMSTSAADVSGDWVIGSSRQFVTRTGTDPLTTRAKPVVVRWNLGTWARQVFPDLSVAMGVNRYGWFTGANAELRPVLVVDDAVRVLPLPPGGSPDAGSLGAAISDDGRVIGGQVALPDTVTAVRWTCG